MSVYFAEFVGTALLILLGNGVVANVVLSRTKGHGAGWIVITAGWAVAVFTAVACTSRISGGHLNPAVTLAMALSGKFAWNLVAGYMVAQLLGAMTGAVLVWLFYADHYRETADPDAKLATFCTSPAIRNLPRNLLCEAIGTMVLALAALLFPGPQFSALEGLTPTAIEPGAVGAVPVALVVFAVGLSLGGTTGYAINPVRDLGPRLVHALLPIPGKRNSDWGYVPVPVLGPLIGAVVAVALARLLTP